MKHSNFSPGQRILKVTKSILLAVIITGLGLPGFAQQNYQLSDVQQWTVAGTSSIHDWEMVSQGATGTARIETAGSSIKAIPSLKLELSAKTLKSGKSSMDDNAYKALNADRHPNIQFELTGVESIKGQEILAKGRLTISGTTKVVILKANYSVSGNAVTFSGSHPISFSEFDLKPPTAVFGTIKTGDQLNIQFETTFKTK